MSEWIALDESTPLTEEQMQKMVRRSKIYKLAELLYQIKYPVYPGGPAKYKLGEQFGGHVYEVIAEYLVDHGVEVDVAHCGECMHLEKKVDCGGFCKCVEVTDGIPMTRVNWGYCDHGERRESCEKK